MLLTLLRRFLSAAKAELWGRSIRTPYRHLYRYGYRSGSRSWRRRSSESLVLVFLRVVRGVLLGYNIHVNTGDSSSWTSLSIWISILTVISSSALQKC